MGQVIEFYPARAARQPASPALYRCARCGTDLWNLLADGRVRCADCEQECHFRTLPGAGAASGHECEMTEGA
jgi:DNA-directed RNA polymerase subunit RPC12/RpoP